jgi:2-phospho-L-lactate guanylyltransferase
MNNIWAIVPVKPLGRAKSRLAEHLQPEQREQLATQLLARTLRLLMPIGQIRGVLVISRDNKALAMARDLGAKTVQESGAPELNNALLRATQVLKTWHADGVLIVPADIPLLAADDIEEMVRRGLYQPSVVIAPDRHETGTNLMLVRPPGLMPYAYGEGSFNQHQRLAAEAGATISVYRSERVALDVDWPDDLQKYYYLAHTLGEPALHGFEISG